MASTDGRFGLPMGRRAKFAASGFGLSMPLRFTRRMLNLGKVAAIDIAFLGISSSRVFHWRVLVGLLVLLGGIRGDRFGWAPTSAARFPEA